MVLLIITSFLGVLFWSLVEYVLHRFGGHEWLHRRVFFYFPINHFKKEHMKHHQVRNYFGQEWQKLFAAFIIFSVIFSVITFLTQSIFRVDLRMSLLLGGCFSVSFVFSYLLYEYFHRQIHVSAPSTSYGHRMRKHHLYHHFADSNFNHGVTTGFWDIIFRTYKPTLKTRIPINRQYILSWMTDEVIEKTSFKRDYELREKTRCI